MVMLSEILSLNKLELIQYMAPDSCTLAGMAISRLNVASTAMFIALFSLQNYVRDRFLTVHSGQIFAVPVLTLEDEGAIEGLSSSDESTAEPSDSYEPSPAFSDSQH